MENIFKEYDRVGFHLAKKAIDPEKAQAAANWLRSQNLKKLAKSFMDQSPCDDLAKYQSIHNGDTPIAKIASDPGMLQIASQLAKDEVYIWGSLVNLKNAWYGRVDYYHQEIPYYAPRGYEKATVINCFIFLEKHDITSAPLNIFPGSHKGGALDHVSVFDVNAMHKLVVDPKDLDHAYKKYGHQLVEAEPGDVLYFHTLLIHGSAHNISPHNRMILLTQVNPKRDKPVGSLSKIKEFNLSRTQKEVKEAKRRYEFYKNKYEEQLKSDEIIFNNPLPKEEI